MAGVATIAVIGAGIMGRGIAHVASLGGQMSGFAWRLGSSLFADRDLRDLHDPPDQVGDRRYGNADEEQQKRPDARHTPLEAKPTP